jgi:formylglycine-generating enzyme required for sulfatase activity
MEPVIRDRLVDGLWPQFLHPFPLDDGRFLVSAKLSPQATWGIYLADLDDNLVPVLVDPKYDFFEPIPLRPRPTPELIPDRIDPSRSDAVVYLHDVYAGPGLRGVPHGAVENLRVIAYEFGYPGMAGPDKIGSGGPWEAMRILGTTPVADDGSAVFRVPANTPICVQPLDAQGKALQLMRSWFTAMPGETVSCVGCHEHPGQTPAVRYELAATQPPHDLQPWYGPPRGFDFERELQPVLDRYCVECHNGGSGPSDTGGKSAAPDLRGERLVDDYRGRPLAKLGFHRLHPQLRELWGGAVVRYTPAYEALVPYIRRVGIEDDVRMLVPGEYHADTSELVQMLAKGHGGVELDAESWDRLITWIDLNGPCHGSWRDVGPIPDDADKRRQELAAGLVPVGNDAIHPTSHRVYPGGKPSHTTSHRVYPGGKRMDEGNVSRKPRPREVTLRARTVLLARSPVGFDHTAAASNPRAGSQRKTIDLGGEVTLELVRIPAGKFVMGSNSGPSDERPPHAVTIGEDFWIGATEITIAQFRRFAPEFHPGYFMKRYPSMDGPGLLLEGPRQPVVRVSWHQARAFCQWLSQRTGLAFDLPTEVQWEYAARAGTTAGVPFGSAEGDFSPWANLADASLARRPSRTAGLESNITAPFGPEGSYRILPGGDIPCAPKFDDGFVATAPVGSFRANVWGLHDMHGNAAEWTRSLYRPYPYRDGDGRNDVTAEGKRVLRGGSFRDRPRRCTASYRLGFPPWQRVHSAGFRIVCRVEPAGE